MSSVGNTGTKKFTEKPDGIPYIRTAKDLRFPMRKPQRSRNICLTARNTGKRRRKWKKRDLWSLHGRKNERAVSIEAVLFFAAY